LEQENAKLKKLLAEQMLDAAAVRAENLNSDIVVMKSTQDGK